MADTDKSFWATIPGILTGLAALVTAVGGLYLALSRPPPPPASPAATAAAPPAAAAPESAAALAQWPLVGAESFGKDSSGWLQGDVAHEGAMSGDVRILGGKYRWDIDYAKAWERAMEGPYEPATDFYLAVDVKLIGAASDKGAGLMFGRYMSTDYTFVVSADRKFIVKHFDGQVDRVLIDWTPLEIDPRAVNRLAVMVENSGVRLFVNERAVGEFKAPTFSGGKVGVAVTSWSAGSSTVEFDNFEYRRKPN